MTWEEELATITDVAAEYFVDPYLIAAIRRAENGGPGREFGILSQDAPNYQAQLRACCATVRNQLDRFDGRPIVLLHSWQGHRRAAYAAPFIRDLAARYAPIGAGNDPTGLNANWVANVCDFYLRAISHGPLTLA